MKPEETFLERLRQALFYNPETGRFIWLKGKRKGRRAGSINRGYLLIKFEQRSYQAARLAWLLTTGEWPIGLIDHRDESSLNNKFSNLRDTDYSGNRLNIAAPSSRNLSGFRGVSYISSTGKYSAKLCGKVIGSFWTAEKASEVYNRLRLEMLEIKQAGL